MTWRVARFSPTPTTGWKGRPFLPNPNYEGAPFLAWFARSGVLVVIGCWDPGFVIFRKIVYAAAGAFTGHD
jgi:hypothetical protein